MCSQQERDIRCAKRASALPGEREEVGREVAAGLREKKAVVEEDVAQSGVILSSTLRGSGPCSAGWAEGRS